MAVITVTKDNFSDVTVTADNRPVLLDFFATWCGPCRMVSPLVDEIADECPEYVVGKINVDEEGELAEKFGVSAIPTLLVLKNGKESKRAIGAQSKDAILELLK